MGSKYFEKNHLAFSVSQVRFIFQNDTVEKLMDCLVKQTTCSGWTIIIFELIAVTINHTKRYQRSLDADIIFLQ